MLIDAVSSLLTPRSPLWQFSKSNANPVVGLCKKASHNIDCHSQLREWGKGLVFTSKQPEASAAGSQNTARTIWSVSIISQQISQGWATYPNRRETMFNSHSSDSPPIQACSVYYVWQCECFWMWLKRQHWSERLQRWITWQDSGK